MLLFILLIIIILLLLISYKECFKKKPNIFLYWENKLNQKKSNYIKLCYKTVLKHCNKSFNIHLVNEKNIYKYLPNFKINLTKNLSIPQKTDYIRLLLLYKYGGIWLDSDIIVMNDLYPLLNHLNKFDFIGAGCYNKKICKCGYTKPGNWFLCSKPNTIFIKDCIVDIENILKSKKVIKYFDIGMKILWKNIKKHKSNGWDYFHIKSQCLERDFNNKKITNKRLLSNEEIDNNCNPYFIPIYNTAPGFPKWFKIMSEDNILNSNFLISKLFKKSLAK